MTIENLTMSEKDTVLRFLLFKLDQETRGELMARHPIEYVKMAPHTRITVLRKVVAATREESCRIS